ncbi:hypothetical protein ACG7HM_000577 [Enterococcus hirae]|uniref:Uncharacterized protein n=1 Tax=Enterococcus hirae TaxID=1354 RepID=A0AB37ICZ7_ENTHR|nr:hypothetical protein [Enterococcus hirae]EMF0484513.1 hypothetical protein [Enterococcus hirae]PCE04235.1 hypothetical protein CKY13_12570 [Enterococcus hirae]RBT42908.1 hypothetical protein EB07_01216 [Enterococcus hirae]RBT48850.1 hypothetical protein EB20_00952 [Enterococcus hirae]RBT54043.1 hypothetical protein EA74_00914 [Enterococcus hirae]
MENFGLQLINSSVLGQTDFISLFTTYLSDYMYLFLGEAVLFVILMLLLSKKMSDKPANKSGSSKGASKQSQYKRMK